MKKRLLQRVGSTTDGLPVVAGVFRFCETYGLPLVDLLYVLQKQGVMVDWLAYVSEAERAGMKRTRVLVGLDVAISDVYGALFRDNVLKRLRRAL
jgi:hypothetical protein